MNIHTREKLQSEKDIKKDLLNWNTIEQTKPLVREFYKGNYENIEINKYPAFSILGKKGLNLGNFETAAEQSATVNEGVEEFVRYLVMNAIYRDEYDGTVIGMGTKNYFDKMAEPIDFIVLQIFGATYIIEKKEFLGKQHEEIEQYICDYIHNASELHAYSQISLSKMIKTKENYPNIKNYCAFTDIDLAQMSIIDVFRQKEAFSTTSLKTHLRNYTGALLPRMKKIYSPEKLVLLNKVLLLGFLYSYYNHQYNFKRENPRENIEKEVFDTFGYIPTYKTIEGDDTIEGAIEWAYNQKTAFSHYSYGFYQNCILQGLGDISLADNGVPTINDIIKAITVNMDSYSEISI